MGRLAGVVGLGMALIVGGCGSAMDGSRCGEGLAGLTSDAARAVLGAAAAGGGGKTSITCAWFADDIDDVERVCRCYVDDQELLHSSGMRDAPASRPDLICI